MNKSGRGLRRQPCRVGRHLPACAQPVIAVQIHPAAFSRRPVASPVGFSAGQIDQCEIRREKPLSHQFQQSQRPRRFVAMDAGRKIDPRPGGLDAPTPPAALPPSPPARMRKIPRALPRARRRADSAASGERGALDRSCSTSSFRATLRNARNSTESQIQDKFCCGF